MIRLNGNDLPLKFFPNGELNAPATMYGIHIDRSDYFTLMWERDSDLVHLMLLKMQCPQIRTLLISFMPYSREDRGYEGSSICSLRFIGEMIQQMGWDDIRVLDPHSDATLAYLGVKAREWNKLDRFCQHIKEQIPADTVVMFPDAGAQKRYMKKWSDYRQCVGFKHRDVTTGKITGYSVADPEIVIDKEVLIVDDLCSYGGTFVAAANALEEFGPTVVNLAVTHCETNAFNETLFNRIGRLYTTNSLLREVPQAYQDRVEFYNSIC